MTQIEAIDQAIARCKGMVGALLPALHAIQDALGYVPETAIPRLADALNLSRAEVTGTLSFYHDFRTKPPGRHVLKVCRAEACQAMGGNALAEHVKARVSDDVTVTDVYCLGNCACAPAVMIDGVLHGRVTRERFDALAKKELA